MYSSLHVMRSIKLSDLHRNWNGPTIFIVKIEVVPMINYEATGEAEVQLQEFLSFGAR